MKIRFGLILLAFVLGAQAASLPVRGAEAPVTDPALVGAHYRKLLARPQFQEPREPDVNTRMRDWLYQFFTRFGARFERFKYAQEMPRFASLLMSIFVLLSLTGLLYALVLFIRGQPRWKEPVVTGDSAPRTSRPPEFYEKELRRAVAAGDWHAAWLASWRQFLSRLEKGRLVETDRSRTNREYLAQLSAQPQSASALSLLGRMVDAYDVFIYGRRTIAEPDWKFFQEQVDEASLLLHVQDRISTPAASPAV